jgi:prevent-host-death family protein
MQLSIREAKARFSEVIAAAQSGERVIVTKYGKEVAEIMSVTPRKGSLDFAAADRMMAEMGWEQGALRLPDDFDDPAFSRKVLGLDD